MALSTDKSICFWLAVLTIFSGRSSYSQSIDWNNLFRTGAGTDPAAQEAVRQQDANELLPKVMAESEELAAADAGAIAESLTDANPAVRLQASGYLLLMAAYRSDSAKVFRSVYPNIQAHFHDPKIRIGKNLVDAVGYLNPAVPPEQINILIELLPDKDHVLAGEALIGISRMANTDANAFHALARVLSEKAPLRLYAIRSIAKTKVFNRELTIRIGDLLNDGDTEIVEAALTTIQVLGRPARDLCLQELQTLAEDQTAARRDASERARRILDDSQ